jgi:hypothetical protein
VAPRLALTGGPLQRTARLRDLPPSLRSASGQPSWLPSLVLYRSLGRHLLAGHASTSRESLGAAQIILALHVAWQESANASPTTR